MMYLIAQTALFLAIACLIGIVIGHFLVRDQKSERQAQLESEAHDARNRSIAIEKEIEEYKARLAELEGLPEGARASRVAAREEVAARMTQLERELAVAQTAEKRLSEESARLKVEVDTFRSRYLEARAKWDEYKAKAEALAATPQPMTLGVSQIVPDESMRKRVVELEGLLLEAGRERERAAEQSRSLTARTRELERQVASAGQGNERSLDFTKSLQARISDLESSLANAARERDGAAQQSQIATARARELEQQIAQFGKGSEQSLLLSSSMQTRISELETHLANAARERDSATQQAQSLTARLGEIERQLVSAGQGSERNADAARTMQARVTELEARLASGFSAARDTDGLRSRVSDLQDKLGEAEVALSKSITMTRQVTEPLRQRIAELESRLAAVVAVPAAAGTDTLTVLRVEEDGRLRAQLADAEAKADAAERSAADAAALRQRVLELETQRPSASDDETRRLAARNEELEQSLDKARRQAGETQSLRTQIVSLETRLAEALATSERSGAGEDVGLLKARLADVESRLMTSSQSSMEYASLRSRVVTLEALLHEAAKSRDEAAVLRSKVAELDGRLGQAMKAMAESRTRNPESEAV